MALLSKLKQPYLWPLSLLLVANGLIFTDPTSGGLRSVGVLILLSFLPGWVWLQFFLTRPLDMAGRLVLAFGLSLALTTLAAMFAVYLPGPLTANQILVTINVLIGGGLLVLWTQQRFRRNVSLHLPGPLYPVLLLSFLLIVAAALRLPRLGYAEFHEDEAEALMLGVRLFQGEDYAIFLHRKGPAQMLVPVTYWLLSGRINEALARFPFALSSILSVATLFFIGRRWFNWQTGIVAGLLWAINGYAIGFARMAQYQALIFLLGPLAIYCLYLTWKDHQPRLQIPATILLATCLLAHFDALLLLPAAAYLTWLVFREARGHKSRMLTVVAFLLFLALLAAFYVPYLLDPEFKHTVTYLSESRVKPGFLYNNLNLLRRLDRDYSSHFYLPLLLLGMMSLIVWQSTQTPRIWRWVVGGLGLLSVSTLWLPDMWQVGASSLAVLPWLLLGLICLWFSPTIEIRIAWIMFGAPFVGYVFLVDDPRTHLYIIYPGAVLLAGAGWAVLSTGIYQWTRAQVRDRAAALVSPLVFSFIIVGLIMVGAIIIYDFTIFLQKESTLSQLRQRWSESDWELIYDDLPEERSYFGYPKQEGWKAIGALRTQGEFPGDFRSMNEDFIIPIWYNYGQARSCYNTPANFFVRFAGNNPPITAEPYLKTGQIEREGEIRLHIFSAGAEPQSIPGSYPLEAYIDMFDQLATPQHFTQQAEPSQRINTQFGSAIKFVGYDLPAKTVTAGETLYLDLYWQALKNPGNDYRAFVHLTDGTTQWAQQDDNPVCRLPTSIWRPGQRGIGQFRLPIKPDTPPGRYPLVIGLYRPETLERLPITAGTGQLGDDFLWLEDIEVVKPN